MTRAEDFVVTGNNGRAARRDESRIYYLHPLLAGKLSDWSWHFSRAASMGFDHVLIAPPFVPGRSGDLFLVADHTRINPLLTETGNPEDAADVLAHLVSLAHAEGLSVLLDLVVDRVANELSTPADLYRPHRPADPLPDPRKIPRNRFAAELDSASHAAASTWWLARIHGWTQAGIAGFRCDATDRLPPSFWKDLIEGTRSAAPDTRFIAWMPAASAASYAGCGFDLVASSSWAWDFRADWLSAENRDLAPVGGLLAMPALPFVARTRSNGIDAIASDARALRFAAAYGQSWLMPMGFEFGGSASTLEAREPAQAFSSLEAFPIVDLRAAASDANGIHAGLALTGRAEIVSAPGAAPVVLRRSNTSMVLVNPWLNQPVDIPGTFVASSGEALAPGEVRTVTVPQAPPILAPAPSVESAITATRIVIEAVAPSVDGGRYAAKQIVGSLLTVTADIVCDGHDKLAGSLLWRPADDTTWTEVPLAPLGNDVWTARFPLAREGRHVFTVEAWADEYGAFLYELGKKREACLNVDVEIREGIALLEHIATQPDATPVTALVKRLKAAAPADQLATLVDPRTQQLAARHDPRRFRLRAPESIVDAERPGAAFASWYEIFPRSQSPQPGEHGTFRDVIARLPAIRDMGFDVLYFPPVHPIGRTNRKGRNNALQAGADDPGSPYAIGSAEGGHDALHPELGSFEDFEALIKAAADHDLEIALDFAIQCSPDHPWLREHPEWFTWRPDGSIRYAENPPKKYEDIVNVAFYNEAAMPALWVALRDVVQVWVNHGVRIFRVDNPHTKPLPFWEWLIADIHSRDPGVLFLAEAFTKPKMMYQLGKIGFAQSYTYFTWRNTAREMRVYLEELTTTAPKLFYRPHFFVNTPDINPAFLHNSGRPGFLLRAALAATLSGVWGVYNGFELCESASWNGREEYHDSEKYQLRQWDLSSPGNIVDEIRTLNRIRRANPALHTHLGVQFLDCTNENLLCFVKATDSHDNVVISAISFDPANEQGGEVSITPEMLGLPGHQAFVVEDLIAGGTQDWHTGQRTIRLNPAILPFAIWRLRSQEAT